MQKGNVEASRVQLWRWVVSRDWEVVVGIESRVCCGELEEAGSVSAGTPHWLRALRLRSRHHRVMRSYKTNITSGLSLGNAKLKKHHKSGPSSHHQNFTNFDDFGACKGHFISLEVSSLNARILALLSLPKFWIHDPVLNSPVAIELVQQKTSLHQTSSGGDHLKISREKVLRINHIILTCSVMQHKVKKRKNWSEHFLVPFKNLSFFYFIGPRA